MPNLLYSFDGIPFPSGFVVGDEGSGQDAGETAVPRRPGTVTGDPRKVPVSLSIRGGWGALDDLEAWKAIKTALMNACLGKKAILFAGDETRYYKDAYLESHSFGDPAEGRLYGILGTAVLNFKASDYPEAFGIDVHAPALATSGGSITYAGDQGDTYTLPIWTITLTLGGLGIITLANTTTGEVCTLSHPGTTAEPDGFADGAVIVLDRDGYLVTVNGVLSPDVLDLRIPRLKPGGNLITLAVDGSGSNTIGSLEVEYQGRWK